MTDLDLTNLREIAEAGVAAGADKPGTYYGPLVTALDPLPVTTLELIDEIERLRETLATVKAITDGTPECDKYDDKSPITCGWKFDLQRIKEEVK